MSEGNFIVLEGIDNAGTSSLTNNLQRHLDNDEWVFTKEPSEGRYGAVVREFLSDENEPTPSDFYLFLADRYEHCENVIRPALEEGTNVLCDRYHQSTLAYQSRILDEQLGIIDPLKYIDEMTGHFIVEPNLVLYIDIPVDVSLERMGDDVEKYEKEETLKEAKRIYDYLCEENDNITRIDGTQSEEAVTAEALKHVGPEILG